MTRKNDQDKQMKIKHEMEEVLGYRGEEFECLRIAMENDDPPGELLNKNNLENMKVRCQAGPGLTDWLGADRGIAWPRSALAVTS